MVSVIFVVLFFCGLAHVRAGSETMEFSIWLQPEKDDEAHRQLDRLIRNLAGKYAGPVFEPHCTLLGAVKVAVNDAALLEFERKVRELAASLQPFTVTAPFGVNMARSSWHQNVLIFLVESEELLHAHAAAIKEFRGSDAIAPDFPLPTKRPHMSLLYGEHSPEERERIVSWIRKNDAWLARGISFKVSALHVWAPQEGAFSLQSAPHWHEVGSFNFSNASVVSSSGLRLEL